MFPHHLTLGIYSQKPRHPSQFEPVNLLTEPFKDGAFWIREDTKWEAVLLPVVAHHFFSVRRNDQDREAMVLKFCMTFLELSELASTIRSGKTPQ